MSLIGDDCFYFMNAGCQRGTYCMYRHQPAAKASVESCPNWLKGSCLDKSCTLRHSVIDSRVVPRALATNNNVQCKWEATTGCLNDQCPFVHVNKITKVPTAAIAQTSNSSVLGNPAIVHNLQPPLERLHQAPLPVNPVVVNGLPPGVVQVPQIIHQIHPGIGQFVPPPANATLLQQPLQVLPPQQNLSVLGVPPQQALQTFPQNEHFTEQVKLFKEILAGKQKPSTPDTEEAVENEEENQNAIRRHKEKERQKRKNRRHKDVKQHNQSKKVRSNWTKGDEEILYGDYKTVRIDKKHKKSYTDTDTEIKSYEDVLREKALRDMYKRRKQDKFKAEFEDILNEKDKVNNGSTSDKAKKRSTDKEEIKNKESVQTKRRKSDSKEQSPKSETFSKEDAVELGLDASPIREFLEELDSDEHDDEHNDEHDPTLENMELTAEKISSTKEKDLPSEIEENKPVLIIPDETADINFSVGDADDDELLQELNQVDESKITKESNKKNRHSRTSKSHRKNEKERHSSKVRDKEHNRYKEKTSHIHIDNSSKTSSKSKAKSAISSIVSKGDRSSPITVKSPRKEKISIEEISSSAKRSVIKIDNSESDSSITSKEIVTLPLLINKNDDVDNKENTTKVKLSIQKETKTEIKQDNNIKIKSFAEIMAEKRQRKAKISDEVLLVSEDGDTPISTCSVKDAVKPLKVKRSNSEEERVKRQSLKLYKPPIQDVVTTSSEIITTSGATSELSKSTKTIGTGGRKVISLKKTKPSVEVVDATSTRVSTAIKSTLSGKKEGGVMSFEQIMEAKRLRKQKEAEAKQHGADQSTLTTRIQNGVTPNVNKPPSAPPTTTVATTKKGFLKRKTVAIRPTTLNSTSSKTKNENVQSTSSETKNEIVHSTSIKENIIDKISNITPTTKPEELQQFTSTTVNHSKLKESKTTDIKPLDIVHVIPKTIERPESLTEEQLLGEITPTTPITPLTVSISGSNITSTKKSIACVSPRMSVPSAPLPNTPKLSIPPSPNLDLKLLEEKDSQQILSQTSMEDIKEALDEEKRKKEKDLLSDDEFEKEIFDLCSGDNNDAQDDDDDDDYGDIDEDDLMMELQEMIDS